MPFPSTHPANRPIWFDLMTSDAAGARAFYGDLLGWTFEINGPEYGHYAMCRTTGHNAAGIGAMPPDAKYPPSWTVYFGVTSADATCDAITKAGGQLMTPPMDVGDAGRMAICMDATGAVFGLWQPGSHPGADIVDEFGAMAWCEVNTRDAAAAATFYQAVFGLTPSRLDDPAIEYWMLNQGEEPVCGVMQMTAEWGDLPPHWMAYFRVPDIHATVRRVAELGGTVAHGPFDTPYGPMAVIIDPQGAVVSMIAPPPG